MTNGEKYRTAQERAEAFIKRYSSTADYNLGVRDFSSWLNLEAEEEKPLPCPFCGSRMIEEKRCDYGLVCAGCEYTTPFHKTIADAIAAHNRVAKKCREVKE